MHNDDRPVGRFLSRREALAGRPSTRTSPAPTSACTRVRERSGSRALSQRSSRTPASADATVSTRWRDAGTATAAPTQALAGASTSMRRARSMTPTLMAESATLNAGQW